MKHVYDMFVSSNRRFSQSNILSKDFLFPESREDNPGIFWIDDFEEAYQKWRDEQLKNQCKSLCSIEKLRAFVQ